MGRLDEHNPISGGITYYRHSPHIKIPVRTPQDKTGHAALCRHGFQPILVGEKLDHSRAQIRGLNPLQPASPRRIDAEREKANSYE